jgi:hypothetical protein
MKKTSGRFINAIILTGLVLLINARLPRYDFYSRIAEYSGKIKQDVKPVLAKIPDTQKIAVLIIGKAEKNCC